MAKFRGTVIHKLYGRGSKSERIAVCLSAEDGKTYVLRRQGGNAFRDPELDKLVGRRIQCDGVLSGSTLIMKSWKTEAE